ncbi:MAG: ester cyclase [Acidimicrobiales bacterium]
MPTATNKAIVRRYFEEVCDAGRLEIADELFTEDFGAPGGIRGPEAAKRAARDLRDAFPDIRFEIDDLVAEGDRVVAKVTYSGTHRGSFFGIAPTGRRIRFTGVELAVLREGRIAAEAWHVIDHADILRQLEGSPDTDH